MSVGIFPSETKPVVTTIFSFIILYNKMLFKPATLFPFYLLKTRSYLVLLSKNKFTLLPYINLPVFLSHIFKTKIPNKILHKDLLLQGYMLDDIQEHFTGKSREEDLSAKEYISVNAHHACLSETKRHHLRGDTSC